MAHPKTSKKKAILFAFLIFSALLVGITLTSYWWPGIMLLAGIPLACKQYLLGKIYDMSITLFVFLGAFVTIQFEIPWKYLLPILFTVGGLYILFRELFIEKETIVEKEEEHNKEIEEKDDDSL